MKLSIIVPVYNVEKYVEKCIRCCENQNIPTSDFEIIAVNDGSTDNSLQILQGVSKDYDNIKIVNQANLGLSAARNAGMLHASGDYYMFVDSDDWITSNCLGSLMSKLEKETPDCLAICAANDINNSIIRRFSYKDENPISGVELLKRGVSPCATFSIWNSLFLKKNNLSFYEGILHEDVEFTSRAYYFAKKVSLINDLVYIVYQNLNSITRTSNPKRSYDLINVVCPRLSCFSENVLEEHKIIYHNLISLHYNNALFNIRRCSTLEQRKLNQALCNNRFLLKHLLKSSINKYRIEGYIFNMFSKNIIMLYKFIQLFNLK